MSGAFHSGATILVTVTWTGGVGPFTVTYYTAPDPPNCVDALGTVFATHPGAVSGDTATTPALTGNTYVCASVTDTGDANAVMWSGVAYYVKVGAISEFINNDENIGSIDLGQSITMTEFASGGAPPYAYQWYGPGGSCGALGPLIVGATSASFTASPGASTTYEVVVTDSSIGSPTYSQCSLFTVTVNPALLITTFTVSPGPVIQVGGASKLKATVIWSGGTGPWWAVSIFSGTDSLCSGDTNLVASLTDITGTEAILSFNAPTTPSTITFYCAVVTDSSVGSPAGVGAGPVQITLNPGLSVPAFSISPTENEINNLPGPLFSSMKVTWSGGSSPYSVTIISGSSATCGNDNTVVASFGPTSLSTHTFVGIAEPTSSTYYCAVVDDASLSETVSASALFTVGPLLAVHAPVLSSLAVDLGQSSVFEGIPETATVTWSGGTGPYNVAFYMATSPGPACSAFTTLVPVNPGFNPLTNVAGFSATFHFLAPAVGTDYCVWVTDNETPSPLTVYSGITSITVSAFVLATPTMVSVAPSGGIDAGQTLPAPIVITVGSISGGTAPYTVSLFSGSSAASCLAFSNKIATKTGVAGPTTTFSQTPTATTYYCASVSDSSEVPVTTFTGNALPFSFNDKLKATLPADVQIPAGTGTTLGAPTVSGGTPGFTYQWYIGAGCVAANALAGQTAATYSTGVLSTQSTYSVGVSDSSSGTPAAFACASETVTINNGPLGVASIDSGPLAGLVYVANPFADSVTVIDSYSNTAVVQIPLFDGFAVPVSPWGVVADSANKVVYVSGQDSTGDAVLNCIDATTNTATPDQYTLGTSQSPQGIALNGELKQLYIANSATNTVDVFQTTGSCAGLPLTLLKTINVGAGPMNIAIDQPSDSVYVTNYASNTVTVIQPRINVFPITFAVTTVTVGSNPFGVAVNPLTHNVYVSNQGSGTVSVINGFNYFVTATIKVGGAPQGIAVSGSLATAYVNNGATGTVSEINLATNTPITSASVPVTVGSGPFAISLLFNPINNPAYPNLGYVTNSGSNTVSVINIATNAVVATIVVP